MIAYNESERERQAEGYYCLLLFHQVSLHYHLVLHVCLFVHLSDSRSLFDVLELKMYL